MIDLAELVGLSEAELERKARKNRKWFEEVVETLRRGVLQDQQECALAYYQPRNPDAEPAHYSAAREIVLCGGNRSSKTETMLAELSIQMTGLCPLSLREQYPLEKLAAPIRGRIVCNSLTDTLDPVIKPKLRWDQWSGTGPATEGRGHWGWMPRAALAGGTWENAYSEKYRTLKVQHATGGYSTCSFLSYDQDLTAFTGTSLHFVGHDELPPADLYRENRMRTLDVRGQLWTAFTPPDEAGPSRADVAWFYDEVYEPGLPGPSRHPDIETFILFTEKNSLLERADIVALASRFTEAQRDARLYGRFLHLSGVVYPLFTVHEAHWCFPCQKKFPSLHRICPSCQSDDGVLFSHVVDRHEVPREWPVVFVIDPHPRKADACGWFALTPSDDVVLIGELEAQGTAEQVRDQVFAWEDAQHVRPLVRLMDPNIATETNDRTERGWTIRMAYDRVGLRCDLANDSMLLGIQNVTELLRPDPHTRRPRFRAFRDCQKFIFGMTHWSWDEWARAADKDAKERVRDRWKDFPDLLRYLANAQPTYAGLTRRQAWGHEKASARLAGRHY